MKKLQLISVFVVLMVLLVACTEKESKPAPEKSVESSESAKIGAYPITVSPTVASTESEEAGSIVFEDVTFEEMPQRLVVLDYGFLDTIDALGVKGVLGIPKGSTSIPAHLAEKYGTDEVADLGTLKSIDFEKVAALEPDAIFISGRQSAFYEELKKITPNVLFIGTDSANYWDGFLSSINKAGEIFGKQDEAAKKIEELEAKRQELQEKAKGYENVLVAMYNDKKISGFGPDANSRFNYVYNAYGFVPVTEDIQASLHGSDFSYESILSVNPAVLFVIDRTVSDVEALKADIENDIIKQTTAYKDKKIVYLDGVNWYFGGSGITIELAKMQEILDELQ